MIKCKYEVIATADASWLYRCSMCGHERVSAYPANKLHRECKRLVDPVVLLRHLQAKFDELDTLPDEYALDAQMAVVEASQNPAVRQKVWHYLAALEKWAAAGCPLRSMESAEKCRQVCLTCPSGKYTMASDSCEVCGCKVGVSRFIPIRSKPRMATETCPKGHWPEG